MSNGFKFELNDRVRDKSGNFGTVMGREMCLRTDNKMYSLTYRALWDGAIIPQVKVAEDDLVAAPSYTPGNVVFYKGVECIVHHVLYALGVLAPAYLHIYKAADPCRTQFSVRDDDVTCAKPKKFRVGDRVIREKEDRGSAKKGLHGTVRRVHEETPHYEVEWDGRPDLRQGHGTGAWLRYKENDLRRTVPAVDKLSATINIGDLPEVQKVLSEASEALKISEQHRAKLGHDLEELTAEIVDLRKENETEKTRAENWMKQCYRARHERDDAEREGATATKAANKNFGIATARLHDTTMVLSRIREAFGLRPNDGVSLAEFAEKLAGENAKLSRLLNSERGTIRLLLKTQRELVGERDMLRATMEAREKQPPRNAEVERLEAEVDRLSSELNRVRQGAEGL